MDFEDLHHLACTEVITVCEAKDICVKYRLIFTGFILLV